MSPVETLDTLWDEVASRLKTSMKSADRPDRPGVNGELEREGWQVVLEKWLWEWERDPAQLKGDGITAPTRELIQQASELAVRLRDLGVPAPHRVAVTGDGGIVFAWEATPWLTTLEIDADGSVEVAEFQNSRLMSQQRFC